MNVERALAETIGDPANHGISVHYRPGGRAKLFGLYDEKGRLPELGRALMAGLSITAAAKRAHASRHTARKLYRVLCEQCVSEGRPTPLCGCGRPTSHTGYCAVRRQAKQGVVSRADLCAAGLHAMTPRNRKVQRVRYWRDKTRFVEAVRCRACRREYKARRRASGIHWWYA